MERPTQRINWDKITRFTPAMYYAYSTAPIWEIDSPTFNGPEDYVQYWTREVQSLVTTSKATIGRWQQHGKQSAQAMETTQNPSTPIFDFASALALEPLPLAPAQVHEKVALLSSNPPRPMALPQQEGQTQYVGAINQLMEMVLADNDYEMAVAQAHYDIQFWNASVFKWTVNDFEPGIFGEPGRIVLEQISPDKIFFDPKCKKLHYKYMDYIVEQHEMEIGEIQAQYPLAAQMVNPEADEVISSTSVSSRNNEDYIQSPQPKLARDAAGRRQKITVLEAWIKDSRTKFQPEILDATSANYEERFKLDADGYILGSWVPRYPDGRLIIVTQNVILKDMANPYPHGQFPYVFPIGQPANLPYSTGDASRIMNVTRKYNNISGDIHAYFQSEVKRPMHADAGAIMNPELAQQVPNDPTYIVELAPSKNLIRRPAVDVPPLVFSYLQNLQNILDMVSGSSGVMRGTIDGGSQLSAEALANLQSFASSRLALSAKFFNAAIRQLAYQLMWILRATVKQEMKVNVQLPDGTSKVIDWKSDRLIFERGNPVEIRQLRASEDYLITIKAGSGNPGAQNQQQAQALQLFNDNAIDRQALLDTLQFPGRQAILERMEKKELGDIQSKAMGKELGVQLNEQIKQTRPGRRNKAK